MWAVNDARAEGTRIVTASHSVIQRNCDPTKPLTCYDGAIVRNVEVTVYDNDQPDILVTQLDPTDPTHTRTDTGSLALEGWGSAVSGTSGHPITAQPDYYSIILASPPTGTSPNDKVVIRLTLSDLLPDNVHVCLSSSDSRFHAARSRSPTRPTATRRRE